MSQAASTRAARVWTLLLNFSNFRRSSSLAPRSNFSASSWGKLARPESLHLDWISQSRSPVSLIAIPSMPWSLFPSTTVAAACSLVQSRRRRATRAVSPLLISRCSFARRVATNIIHVDEVLELI